MATYQFTGRISTIELTGQNISFVSDTIQNCGCKSFSMACKCNSDENKIENWVQIPDSFSVDEAKYNLLRQHSDDKFKIEYDVNEKEGKTAETKETEYKITKIWLIK